MLFRRLVAAQDAARSVYNEYPRQFWLLVGASFIDQVGNALIFPFFAMFLTDHFEIDLAQVGVIFAIFSAAGLLGSAVGGALADRFGRKPIALTALVTSALGNLALVMVNSITLLYAIAALIGLVGSIGGPAWQAMMADLLPEEKRVEGFGIIRITFNLAVTFGPIIGGLLAGLSYLLLFSVDAATSVITAVILFALLRETRPERMETDAPAESLVQTFRGYGRVFRDRMFITFTVLGMVVWLVYFQMNSTLSVYLRDVHGIEPWGFGLLLSMNAVMVVLLQLSITRQVRKRGYPSMLILAVGTLFYAIGFSLFGFVASAWLFILAMVIITVGEMLVVPVGQAIAARLAPEDMRGRYMAVFGFGFAVASGSGTWLAGQIKESLGFEWVWYLGGIVAGLAALAYLTLQMRADAEAFEPVPALDPVLEFSPEQGGD
ncbi:MAG TPA: MFS transporter [Aggregatilinea sp.]|uniref:MDR family MFS transporter n=1 Tax=Aggregatilinea sp. TaxID=2806333 RepID=UPI002BB70A0B|nr:MFS transporter [Aggregatilinea sp.]HML25025.1 MFS transporter [Aggregatilinea sp.]